MNSKAPPPQALIVIDLQRAFTSGDDAVPDAADLLRQIHTLLRRARAAAALVIHLQNDGAGGTIDQPGTPGWELHLSPTDRTGETVIRKTTDDGFHDAHTATDTDTDTGINLSGVLTQHHIQSIALCGLLSEMCVSATARSALAHGLHVVIPHDAHATYDIPAIDHLSERIPAKTVSRVAEWALGDEVHIVPRAEDVRFSAAQPTSGHRH